MATVTYNAAPISPNEEVQDIVLGMPKCRNFHQTGAPYQSRPHLPFAPMTGMIPWRWFPWKIRIRMPSVLRWLSGFFAVVSLVLFYVFLFFNRPAAWCCLIFINLCFTFPFLYVAYIMVFNFKLREGICWCAGKSVQAKEAWRKTTDPSNAKHVFFEWECGSSLVLKVLNDGTQECWNLSGDELASELSQALGAEGFVGNIVGEGGVASVGLADGAVANKRRDRSDRQSYTSGQSQQPAPRAYSSASSNV